MTNSFSVLFFTSWYPVPEYPTHGIFIKNLAKALSSHCNVIVLYVYSSNEVNEPILEHTQYQNLNEYILTFPKSKIPFLKTLIHFTKYILYYYQLARLAKKHFSDIRFVQINVIYPIAIFFWFLKRILKIKHYTIFEQWTGYLKEDHQYKGYIRKFFTKKTISHAKKIWCLCNEQKTAMESHGLKGNYEILGNVVNTDIFQYIPKNNNSIKQFIHVSTLDDRQKNISGLLNVFSSLEKEGYRFHLTMIGGNEVNLKNAKQMAENLMMKQIEFTGIMPQEKLAQYYQSADALVMFSNFETFCVAVYEAMSCGTYVISTNVADLDKIITPDVGKIISRKNENELKDAVIEIIKEKNILYQPEKARQIIEKNFSEKIIGETLYNYYLTLNHHL